MSLLGKLQSGLLDDELRQEIERNNMKTTNENFISENGHRYPSRDVTYPSPPRHSQTKVRHPLAGYVTNNAKGEPLLGNEYFPLDEVCKLLEGYQDDKLREFETLRHEKDLGNIPYRDVVELKENIKQFLEQAREILFALKHVNYGSASDLTQILVADLYTQVKLIELKEN